MTPSCLEAIVSCAGFRVEHRASEAFAQTIVARTVSTPFQHRLPGEEETRAEAVLSS
jgi:hypothetical protein